MKDLKLSERKKNLLVGKIGKKVMKDLKVSKNELKFASGQNW